MKAYSYVSIGTALIMIMMGIIFLMYPFPHGTYLGGNDFIRYTFGGLLVVYGIFRAYNGVIKLKQKNRKLHYYDRGNDTQNDML